MDELKQIFDIDHNGELNEAENALLQTYLAEEERRKAAEMMPQTEEEMDISDVEKDNWAKLDAEYRRQING